MSIRIVSKDLFCFLLNILSVTTDFLPVIAFIASNFIVGFIIDLTKVQNIWSTLLFINLFFLLFC